MNHAGKIRRKRSESGVALILAIFVLLIVAVAGIAMMAASSTETTLTGNYRSATGAYYAAMSGLEEGRGRLLPKNPWVADWLIERALARRHGAVELAPLDDGLERAAAETAAARR